MIRSVTVFCSDTNMMRKPNHGSLPRRRLLASCQNCRIQHLKCDLLKPACKRCQKLEIECIRKFDNQFRYGSELKAAGELSFPEGQTWLELEAPLSYHDDTPIVASFYDVKTIAGQVIPEETTLNSENQNFAVDASQLNRTLETELPNDNLNKSVHWVKGITYQSPRIPDNFPALMQPPPRPTQGNANSSDTFTGSDTSQTKADVQVISLNGNEASLIRNFIDNMALWADITDSQRYFELEVPRRALNNRLLRYAIFAFSSRHIRRGEDDDQEALYYHGKCVQELLPTVSGSPDKITEDVLAAIAILRQSEEMENQDHQFHLSGATNIVNSISRFSCSGGLGEAAAWLCLREDLYVSLVFQRPLQIRLENFLASSAFRNEDDFSWAARMVFLLCKVLKYAFDADADFKTQQLQITEAEINNWNTTKPKTFNPIKYIPRSLEQGRALPEIWLLSPCHVVGVQYFHIAKIVLAVSMKQSKSSHGYEDLIQGRRIEKLVGNHLCTALGLARYNEKAENTLFTARHILCVWGGLLRHSLERSAAIELLTYIENKTGWMTAALIQSLKAQWVEDSEVD